MKYLVLSLALLFVPANFISAQINANTLNNIGGSNPSIDLEPAYPGPNSEVTASINDFALSTQASGVVWYLDGKKISEASDQRSIKVRTKEMGETMNISAVLQIKGANTLTIEKNITPIYLDIIVEPQTRVPNFYQGRALPSLGSEVNLTAIVNGGEITPENLTYQWRLNNKVIGEGSLRSKYKVSVPISYGANSTVSLIVSKLNSEIIARKDVSLPSIEPKVLFYEINTLYGTKQIPINKSFSLISNTGSIHAEPYFLDILTYNRPSMIEWKIDGTRTPNTGTNPYEITLTRQGGQGSSQVDFHVRNLEGLLQGTQGSVNINY